MVRAAQRRLGGARLGGSGVATGEHCSQAESTAFTASELLRPFPLSWISFPGIPATQGKHREVAGLLSSPSRKSQNGYGVDSKCLRMWLGFIKGGLASVR